MNVLKVTTVYKSTMGTGDSTKGIERLYEMFLSQNVYKPW